MSSTAVWARTGTRSMRCPNDLRTGNFFTSPVTVRMFLSVGAVMALRYQRAPGWMRLRTGTQWRGSLQSIGETYLLSDTLTGRMRIAARTDIPPCTGRSPTADLVFPVVVGPAGNVELARHPARHGYR